jgi:hypothetical protein
MRIFIAILLLLVFTAGVQAQKRGAWASARERGLKGAVHTVVSTCSSVRGKLETRYKYEFDRDGKLLMITGPQLPHYDCIISVPVSNKIAKRNNRGDVEEVAIVLEGEVLEKERYEYEYDSAGNWIKQVTFRTRTYEAVGDDWKAGEWRALYVCTRTIEYYP